MFLLQQVMSGKLVVGLNPHGEITSLLFPGRVSLHKEQIMNCIRNAFSKAKTSAEMIQKAVEDNLEKRKGVVKPGGFTNSLTSDATYARKRITRIIPSGIKTEFVIPQEPVEDLQDSVTDVKMEDIVLNSDQEDDPTPPRKIKPRVNEKLLESTSTMDVENDSEEEEVAGKLTAQDLQ
ncbi:exosome complex component RRP45-like [Homarus americanus]|uniref:exosome complex component RRP45-like n=1 Tax=Homarus americanus TaxID=6706 RepID=UPI001C46EC59|nr:exosome complex component RRP45-like [Homarus americanus]